MNPTEIKAWLAAHKKAIAAAAGGMLAELSGLVAANVLTGQTAHNVALLLAGLGPVVSFIATWAGPANATS